MTILQNISNLNNFSQFSPEISSPHIRSKMYQWHMWYAH